MSDNKKLTIIIPVYNGEKYVGDAIESVLSQLPEFEDDVEFLIRDNCSSDETIKVIKKYQEDNPGKIRLEIRDQNASADINFIEAIHMARGAFVQILGDDDLLFPTSIYQTINIINKSPHLGLIYYNRLSTTIDYKGLTPKHRDPCPKMFRYYDNGGDFIKSHISGPDFISVNVFRRECFLKGEPFYQEKYYGYGFYYCMLKGILFEPCLYVSQPGVLQRSPYKRAWTDYSLLYFVGGLYNIFSDLDKDSPGIKDKWDEYAGTVDVFSMLGCVSKDRPLYKDKWPELKRNLSSVNKLYYRIVLRSSVGLFFYSITNMLWTLIRKVLHRLKIV